VRPNDDGVPVLMKIDAAINTGRLSFTSSEPVCLSRLKLGDKQGRNPVLLFCPPLTTLHRVVSTNRESKEILPQSKKEWEFRDPANTFFPMNTIKAKEWDKQVKQALTHYNRTAEIREILLQGFDQNGKWIDLQRQSDGEFFDEKLTEKISSFRIPRKDLTHTSETGEVTLRGSFVSKSKTTVVRYDYVRGNLFACEAKVVEAPNLKIVQESVLAPVANIFFAPLLQAVGSHLNASFATKFHAPKLESVGHDLTTRCCDFYNPNLKVGGEWEMHPDATEAYVRDQMEKMLAVLFPKKSREKPLKAAKSNKNRVQ